MMRLQPFNDHVCIVEAQRVLETWGKRTEEKPRQHVLHAASGGADSSLPPPESVGPVEGSPGAQPPPMCVAASCLIQMFQI